MLSEPVRFAIRRCAAIQPQKNDRLSAPKISQIDGLITRITALVNNVITAKPRQIFRAYAVDAVFSLGLIVLGPALAFEGRPRFFGMYSPPLEVAGIEDIGKACASVGVIDGDGCPSCAGNRITIFGCKAWTAGDDTSNSAPPAASGPV